MLILVLSLTLFRTLPGLANEEKANYTLRHYTSESGLPQNSVRSIVQDRDGFLWLATDLGLVRFDGQSFVTYGKKELGIRTNQIMSFAPDPEGRKDRIYAMSADCDHIKISDGRPTLDYNLLEFRFPGQFKAKEASNDWFYSIGLPDRYHGQWPISHYLFLFPDSKGTFYMWRKGGKIDFYQSWRKQGTYASSGISPFRIFRLGEDLYQNNERGNIELLTMERKVTHPRKVKLISAKPPEPVVDQTKPYIVYTDDLSGQTFISQDQKLYLLSQRTKGDLQTTLLLENFDFKKNSIVSILFDEKNRRLYLGASNKGFFVLDFHAFETVTVDSKEPDANVFYSQIPFSDSTVLTPSLKVLGKGATGKTIRYEMPKLIDGIQMNRLSVLISRSGDIWYRKMNMLYCFDGKSKKLKGQWNAGGEISPIYEDSAGRIWVGTRFDGLQYIDPTEAGTPLHIFTRKITGISYLLEENSDILWVGTGTGLFKISIAKKTFSLIANTSSLCVTSLYAPHNGELWFTTCESGFFLLQNGVITRLPLDKDKILSRSHCIFGDKNGFLWITTNHGLFQVYRKDLLDFSAHHDSSRLYYHRYAKQDGFRIDEFNGGCQPCAVQLENGYVSLPSIDGLVFFNPELVPVDTPDSKIFIDRVEADSKKVQFSGSKIELSDASNIQVFVSSPYLGSRQNQQLYYSVSSDRTNETSPIWYPLENHQQSIHLNNLESGVYTLRIRKNAGFGASSERLTTLAIIIPYAWYEVWPFQILAVLLLLTAVYFYFRNRLSKADRLNNILESRVAERTHNLRVTLSALKDSEEELLKQTRVQTHLIASISHDIRSPLRAIEYTSARLSGLIDSGEHTTAKAVGSSVNDSSRKILSLLEGILIYVRSQVSKGAVTMETFGARELVDEVVCLFKDVFVAQRNEFQNNVSEMILIRSNRQLLKIILHNLLDNANKFTSEGSVNVSAKQERGIITIIISDTGPGLPSHVQNWLNGGDSAYPESTDSLSEFHGIGLVIVKELADMLSLEIDAKISSGTQFFIRIPYGS